MYEAIQLQILHLKYPTCGGDQDQSYNYPTKQSKVPVLEYTMG
jgi:hypothetical protein